MKNLIPYLKTPYPALLAPATATAGFFIDRWIKIRAENLTEIKEIRQVAEKQLTLNHQFIQQLPSYESRLGFYFYHDPSPAKLESFKEQYKTLLQLIEVNERLKQRLHQLPMIKKFSLPREDYRQAKLLAQELNEQATELALAKDVSSAFYFYSYQNYEAAQITIRKVIQQLNQPSFQSKNWESATLLAVAYHFEGKTYRIQGDIPKAISSYEQAQSQLPQVKYLDIQAEILSQFALLLSEESFYSKQSHNRALTLHQKAYQVNPFSALVLANYARGIYLSEIDAGKTPSSKALNLLDKAINLEPNYATYHLYRGIIMMHQAQLQPTAKKPLELAALQDFEAGLKQQPKHSSLLCRIALSKAQQPDKKDKAMAITHLDELKKVIELKEDRLQDAPQKIAKIEKLKTQIETQSINYPEAIQECQSIARFFYHRTVFEQIDASPTLKK